MKFGLDAVRSFFRRVWTADEGFRERPVELKVHLAYDDEANVWFVAKSDIDGLSLEADTPGKLVERIFAVVPELIELNDGVCVEQVGPHFQSMACHVPAHASATRVLPVFDNSVKLAAVT